MVGAGDSGARQTFGRTSVVPGGHEPPGWIEMFPACPPGCAWSVPPAASDAISISFRIGGICGRVKRRCNRRPGLPSRREIAALSRNTGEGLNSHTSAGRAFSLSKNSRCSLLINGMLISTDMRLGIAINPLSVSAMSQTRWRDPIAPRKMNTSHARR